jgi:hypothetical protein
MEQVNQIFQEIKNEISEVTFEKLYSLGLIDEIALRNLIIKTEYNRLRESHSLYSSVNILSNIFHLSEAAINTILFRKRKTKSVNILPHFN